MHEEFEKLSLEEQESNKKLEEQLYNLIDEDEFTNYDSEERASSPNQISEALTLSEVIKESDDSSDSLKTFCKIATQ